MTIQKSSQTCPHCGRNYVIGQDSCSACGLVFTKWEKRQQGPHFTASQRLEIAWQDILNQWQDEIQHQKFVDLCLKEHNLAFAALKYRLILSGDPHNEICQKMQQRIKELATVSLIPISSQPEKPLYSNKMIYTFFFLAALMILLGFNMPGPMLSTGFPMVVVGIFAFGAILFLRRFFL